MPWTFAHPAAAVLVRRFGGASLPLSGLAMGSLSPDFGYYVGAFGLATHAHTLRGTLEVCVPSAFVLLLIVLRLRGFLVAPVPQPHRRAIECLPSPSLLSTANTARMLAALWVGAMTHVGWDSFTHAGGAMVSVIAPLRHVLFEVSGRTFATYNILQHVGTLFGIVVIGTAYGRWLSRTVGMASCLQWRALRGFIPLVLVLLSCAAIGFASAVIRLGPGSGWPVIVFRGIVDATIAFAAAYLLLACHAWRKRTARIRGERKWSGLRD